MPLLPTVVVGSGSEKFLYVVQTDSQVPGTFTSFVWPGEGAADLTAETALVIAYDPSETSQASFPVPDEIATLLYDTQSVKIDADIEPTNDVLANLENALGKLTKHGIFGHKLEFLGLCSQCRMAGEKFPEDEEPV